MGSASTFSAAVSSSIAAAYILSFIRSRARSIGGGGITILLAVLHSPGHEPIGSGSLDLAEFTFYLRASAVD